MVGITLKTTEIRRRLYPEDSYAGQNAVIFTEFLKDVRRAYPHLTFYRTGSGEAWILTHKDDLYGVAKISYDDVRLKRRTSSWKTPPSDQMTFNLYSRTIVNPNVRDDRDEHHMKRTATGAKLLPVIGQYVKALTAPELIRLTMPDVSHVIHEFYSPIVRRRDMCRRTAGLVPDSPVERYILSVSRAQTGTLPTELKPVLDYIEVSDELSSINIRSREVRAVVFGPNEVRVMVVATRYRYDGVPDFAYATRIEDDEYTIYGYDEVPQVIKDRVNVLNIGEPLEFIPNVGVKHNDTVFYVVI